MAKVKKQSPAAVSLKRIKDEMEDVDYAKDSIVGDTYGNDCFVYVRSTTTPAENDTQEPSMKNFWIARVLQVRAKDASHVYALVAWMYWPDELPKPKKPSADQVNKAGGKRTYHGAYELVASNYLEVVDVLSFAGKADVQQWDEDEDGDQIRSQLYWRQTFSRETHALSPIREHCICKGHYNPDVPMYICDNAECKIWLHKQCLIDHTLTKEFEKINLASGSTSNSKGRSTKTKPYAGVLSGKPEERAPTKDLLSKM
ncbi:hypothetical protein M7I_0229 [Glarea lozoyensis 74030]|uniref:BAH domain-containing protein n=1 Tax=Glarea lozoyensis (strain ATCC 74030 / MF5533) TaxID=1104152 RepID=H0ECT4_GLAL7|nr:hypothetical protein M7I_0229 [Glarea lozoyensis 74030]